MFPISDPLIYIHRRRKGPFIQGIIGQILVTNWLTINNKLIYLVFTMRKAVFEPVGFPI